MNNPFASSEEEEEEVSGVMAETQKKEEISDVFGSDSESDEDGPKKKRRRLGKKKKKEDGGGGEKKKGGIDDDGQSAYDKEVEVKETEEDRDFIDSESDDNELLKEYGILFLKSLSLYVIGHLHIRTFLPQSALSLLFIGHHSHMSS